MMFVMLVAGIGLVLAGLLAIGYGIQVNEFSTGNTLIIAGVIGVCTGMIMLGLWMAVRELKNIARRLGAGVPERAARPRCGRCCLRCRDARCRSADGGFLVSRDQAVAEPAASGRRLLVQRHAAAVAGRGCPARSSDPRADAP